MLYALTRNIIKGNSLEITSNTQSYSSGVTANNETNKDETTFQDLIRDNSNNNKENKENKKIEEETIEVKRTAEELVNDIMSLFKTGLTVGEVEALQELLRDLKEKIKEGNYSEKEIEKMLSGIEKSIQALQKSISGVVIIEAEDNQELKGSSSSETDFFARIDEAMSTLENLKTGKEKKEASLPTPNDSELLEMIRNFQN